MCIRDSDWATEKFWFFLCRCFKVLALKWLFNNLVLSSVENVMVILPRLCRLNWNYARLCSTLILETLVYESCFVSQINILVDIMSFSYWGFISQLEVGSERYGFTNANHQTITWVNIEIVAFKNIFRSFYIIKGIARKLQSVVSSTSLIMYRSLVGLKTELNKHETEIWEVAE